MQRPFFHLIIADVALLLELGNAGLVLLNVDLGGGDPLAQSHIGGLGRHAPLGVVELANLDISLADGVLLAGVVQAQLGDLSQLLGLGHASPAQVHRPILQFVKKSHMLSLLTVRHWNDGLIVPRSPPVRKSGQGDFMQI